MTTNIAVTSLNGAVQSQGVALDCRDWLDIGSPTWAKTSDRDKATAYQAAVVLGWTEAGLLAFIANQWGERVSEEMARFTLDALKELAERHPVEVCQVYEVSDKPVEFKLHGMESTFRVPKGFPPG